MNIVFFAHNRQDAAVVRRMAGFAALAWKATGIMFRRDDDDGVEPSAWENVDLGHIDHAHFGPRILHALSAFRLIWTNRRILQSADLIYARNLDMALIALASRALLSRGGNAKPQFVYECLDVHESLTRSRMLARVLRWLERRVLARCSLLVHSSPGFIDNYFTPVQKYTGPAFWLENKLFLASTNQLTRPTTRTSARAHRVLSWVGIIRCRKTLLLLLEVARTYPHIEIRIHGKVSYFLLPDFDELIKPVPNIHFHGPYTWPEGLADVYADTDFTWSQELSWQGHNSDWLIPNRVYEASYFGVPSIALAHTQTGAFIKARRLGFTLEQPSAHELASLVLDTSPARLLEAQQHLIDRPAHEFVHAPEDLQRLALALVPNDSSLARA